jgi:hypothetical protein
MARGDRCNDFTHDLLPLTIAGPRKDPAYAGSAFLRPAYYLRACFAKPAYDIALSI